MPSWLGHPFPRQRGEVDAEGHRTRYEVVGFLTGGRAGWVVAQPFPIHSAAMSAGTSAVSPGR